MKKIISILAILFCFATLYGQETKPTKQETIDWIISKFKNYPNGNGNTKIDDENMKAIESVKIKFVKNENNKLIFKADVLWISHDKSDGERFSINRTRNYILDLTKLISIYTPNNGIYLNGSNICYQNEINNDGSPLHNSDWKFENQFTLFQPGGVSNWDVSFIDFSVEPDLKSRMIKALQTLIEYNIAEKPKEKF